MAVGVLGLGAIAAPSTSFDGLAMRDKDHKDHGDGHDNGQQDNEYNHACTSNDHHVIGNVCVIVDDLPILGNILSST